MTKRHDIAGAVLAEAKNLVTGDRAKAYGDPLAPYQTFADFTTTYLRAVGWTGPELMPHNMLEIMELLKQTRSLYGYHPDNRIDRTGYAALAEACDPRSVVEPEAPEADD